MDISHLAGNTVLNTSWSTLGSDKIEGKYWTRKKEIKID